MKYEAFSPINTVPMASSLYTQIGEHTLASPAKEKRKTFGEINTSTSLLLETSERGGENRSYVCKASPSTLALPVFPLRNMDESNSTPWRLTRNKIENENWSKSLGKKSLFYPSIPSASWATGSSAGPVKIWWVVSEPRGWWSFTGGCCWFSLSQFSALLWSIILLSLIL